VHVDKTEVPDDYVVMAIRFSARKVSRPGAVKLSGVNNLTPDDFKHGFYGAPVIRVPSVIVPREFNFVLLPDAPGFSVTVDWIERLHFDQRLFSV